MQGDFFITTEDFNDSMTYGWSDGITIQAEISITAQIFDNLIACKQAYGITI